MYRKRIVLATLLMLLSLSGHFSADDISFSKRKLREAVRLLDDEAIKGSRRTVLAPSAALLLFPQLTHEFNRIERRMVQNEMRRRRPEGTEEVVNSYELDIQSRKDFNAILRELRQHAGELEERFHNLENILGQEAEIFEEEAAAFCEADQIIERDISPVAMDPEINHFRVFWPEALPEGTSDALDGQLRLLLATEYLETRTAEWLHLNRIFERFRTDHQTAYQQALRDMDMERGLLRHDPAQVFKEIGYMIAYCIRENEEANNLSDEMRRVILGEISSQMNSESEL